MCEGNTAPHYERNTKMTEMTYKSIIEKFTPGTICSMETSTPVKATKKSRADKSVLNPYGEVRKSTAFTTHLGIKDYETLVNAHRVNEGKEADFEAKSAWYTKEAPAFGRAKNGGTPVAIVNDEGMSVQSRHFFTADGTELVGSALEDFTANFAPLPSKGYENQGTEAKVRVRAIKLENIKSITIGGVTYR